MFSYLGFIHVRHLLCTIFVRKTACQKYFFQILSQKNVQIVNLKIPDLEMIRIIHPEREFFGVAQKKAQSVFGFGNADLDFPKKKTHPR